ncbi:hypothetical protein [Alishewanella phage vB_AspM_Slicko01]|nr:hypothetical protein [Alishewanella phage vB_AspM_Slicko01]
MNMNDFKIPVTGVYGIKIKRKVGTDMEYIEDFGKCNNMLLDGFFVRAALGILQPSSWLFFVGTGSNPVVATQSQLTNLLEPSSNFAAATELDVEIVGSDYFMGVTGEASWDLGAIVGNISEIGVSLRSDGSSTELDSRALITPAALTVTAEDQLVVSYTLRAKIPTTQPTFNVTLDGVATTITMETRNCTALVPWRVSNTFMRSNPYNFGLIQVSSTQELDNDPTVSTDISDSGYFYGTTSSSESGNTRVVTTSMSINDMNHPTPIKYIAYSTDYYSTPLFGLHFNPPFTKDASKAFSMSISYTLVRG